MGAALLLLVLAPVWRLLTLESAPMAREALRLTDAYAVRLAVGTVVVLLIATIAALPLREARIPQQLGERWKAARSLHILPFATALATLSALLTAAVSFHVWGGKPAIVDALAHFVQARYLAEGLMAGPSGLPYEFWVVANTFVTANGWVSEYLPGHAAVLALALRAGAPWAAGPMLMGITTFFTTLSAERLIPEDRTAARLGALLLALSPFLMTVAAAQLSHVTAAAMISVGTYCALRARDGGWQWALGAGVAIGAVFATRPLSAVTIGVVVTLGVWLTRLPERRNLLRYLGGRALAAFLGAVPFVAAVMAYNAHFFGDRLRFGYVAYMGAAHGLGFHLDPRGNAYGPVESLAYTSSDLLTLGLFLLRTPISAVVVIGAFLLVAKRLSAGVRLIAVWAVGFVVPLAFYWHHDLLLGPRLMSDAAPAWCLLAAVGGLGLVRTVPRDRLLFNRLAPRAFVAVALLVSLVVGLGWLTPRALRDYSRVFARQVAPLESEAPLLVFVHDSWNDRIAARLIAAGMRADSVSMALERNSTCSMEEFVAAYASRVQGDSQAALPALAFAPESTDGSTFTRLESGVVVRLRPNEVLTPGCRRQADADRHGTLPLMPLLWQGDLPGLGGRRPMYLRDLGPPANESVIELFPEREPAVLFLDPSDRSSRAVPYDAGMRALWGEAEAPEAGTRR